MNQFLNFEKLSSQINNTQRQILSAVWRHFLDKGQWPLVLRLHRDFGKQNVHIAIKPLGGMVIREIVDSGKQRYQLTFLGILLTDQGKEIEGLIVQYLKWLEKKFDAEPELETITSQEVGSSMELTPEQSSLLGKVVHLSFFLGGSGSSSSGWSARFPNDIDELVSISNLYDYLRRKVMDKYDPALPVDERGRTLYGAESAQDKELEQKFRIMWSPNQAASDFDSWSREPKLRNHCIALLFVDIDHFKTLNSRHTEPKIDETILPEAQHLFAHLSSFRGEAYKYGGDEFVVILPNHTAAEAFAFAERLRLEFSTHQFVVDGIAESLTISGGVALWPEHGDTYRDVLKRASEAKRLAKESRNTIKLADLKHSAPAPPISPRSPAFPSAAPADKEAAEMVRRQLHEKIHAAIEVVQLSASPVFSLAAAPYQSTEIQGLFSSRDSDVVRELENPKRLRPSGFGPEAGSDSRIVAEGQARRTIVDGWKLLEVWTDGFIICIANGGADFLCHASKASNRLRINQLVLIEATYLFVQFVSDILAKGEPRPQIISYQLGFRGITIQQPAILFPGPLSQFPHGEMGAPASEKDFKLDAPFGTDPRSIAFKLIAQVYRWFGFDEIDIPYTDNTASGEKVVSPDHIIDQNKRIIG